MKSGKSRAARRQRRTEYTAKSVEMTKPSESIQQIVATAAPAVSMQIQPEASNKPDEKIRESIDVKAMPDDIKTMPDIKSPAKEEPEIIALLNELDLICPVMMVPYTASSTNHFAVKNLETKSICSWGVLHNRYYVQRENPPCDVLTRAPLRNIPKKSSLAEEIKEGKVFVVCHEKNKRADQVMRLIKLLDNIEAELPDKSKEILKTLKAEIVPAELPHNPPPPPPESTCTRIWNFIVMVIPYAKTGLLISLVYYIYKMQSIFDQTNVLKSQVDALKSHVALKAKQIEKLTDDYSKLRARVDKVASGQPIEEAIYHQFNLKLQQGWTQSINEVAELKHILQMLQEEENEMIEKYVEELEKTYEVLYETKQQLADSATTTTLMRTLRTREFSNSHVIRLMHCVEENADIDRMCDSGFIGSFRGNEVLQKKYNDYQNNPCVKKEKEIQKKMQEHDFRLRASLAEDQIEVCESQVKSCEQQKIEKQASCPADSLILSSNQDGGNYWRKKTLDCPKHLSTLLGNYHALRLVGNKVVMAKPPTIPSDDSVQYVDNRASVRGVIL